MAGIDLLTDEVRRIITAPYAVWLKNLHDIINKVDRSVLQQWAEGHPCQINALAKAVIDGLQQWPHVVDILREFCRVVAFRNAALTIRPSLLDTLLHTAVESQDGYNRYFSACISMLSAPLPEDTPLPASAAVFFQKVMETAVQTASALTIRPIYSMLVGVGPRLLDVMLEAEVLHFQDRLIRLLRNVDDQTANLLCLAIFARLVTRPTCSLSASGESSQAPTPANSTIRTDQTARYNTIEQFFNQKRAAKTLDLVVLRVIFACSSSSNLSSEDSVESLKLAKEIIAAVNDKEKSLWLKANGPKVRKLYEKVLRLELARDLQSLAFEVIISLVKVESLPAHLAKTYQGITRGNEPLIVRGTAERHLSQRAIEYLAPRMEEAFVSEVMESILKAAVQQVDPSYEALRISQTSGSMVSAFATAVNQSSQLRSTILFTLSANAFNRPLNDFLTVPLPVVCNAETCADHPVCPAALARSQRRLRLDICSLFLRTGLLASTDQAGIDPALAISLLEKQEEFSTAVPACRFANQSFQRNVPLSLVEQTSTPSERQAGLDWRDRLSADLLRNAKSNSDSVLCTVDEICRDLEERCEVTERPLKEEQARSKDLQIKLESARTEIADLKFEAEERNLFLKGLDAEKSSLECQIKANETRITDLAERLQEMEAKSAEIKAEAEKSAAIAREEASNQDLKHLAIINAKEDNIAEQSERTEHLEQALKAISEELTATSEGSLAAQRRIGQLETEAADTAEAREVDRASIAQKDMDIDRLHGLEVHLRAEIEATANTNGQQTTRIDSLQRELQSARASSEEYLESLKQRHESEKVAAATEMARLRHNLEEEMVRLSDDHQQAVQAVSMECRAKNSTISGLERRIEKLLEDREEKAREFAEAQDLSTKLMAVMGLRTEHHPALAHNPAPGSKDIFVDSPNALQGSRRQTVASPAQSYESSASSKSDATSKRVKSRRITRTPPMHQTKINTGAKTVKTAHDTASRSTRQPLNQISVSVHNRSPVRARQHALSKPQEEREYNLVEGANQVDELMGLGDLSFSGSDIFTSTEKDCSSARDGYGHSQLYDESTADF